MQNLSNPAGLLFNLARAKRLLAEAELRDERGEDVRELMDEARRIIDRAEAKAYAMDADLVAAIEAWFAA